MPTSNSRTLRTHRVQVHYWVSKGAQGQGWVAWWVDFRLNAPRISEHYLGYLLPRGTSWHITYRSIQPCPRDVDLRSTAVLSEAWAKLRAWFIECAVRYTLIDREIGQRKNNIRCRDVSEPIRASVPISSGSTTFMTVAIYQPWWHLKNKRAVHIKYISNHASLICLGTIQSSVRNLAHASLETAVFEMFEFRNQR